MLPLTALPLAWRWLKASTGANLLGKQHFGFELSTKQG
jgi:hypothetical protein